jgi:hypothetical protein
LLVRLRTLDEGRANAAAGSTVKDLVLVLGSILAFWGGLALFVWLDDPDQTALIWIICAAPVVIALIATGRGHSGT